MQAQKNFVDIIGFDCGWGCKDYGCEDGPSAIAIDQILNILSEEGLHAKWHGTGALKFLGNHEELTTKEDTLPLLMTCLNRLSQKVFDSVSKRHLPIVIGGDHSSAIGTWSGIVSAQKSHENFGLIWIDAHMDCHTYKTSASGKHGGWWHGQPLTALTGYGLNGFKEMFDRHTKLSPKHITLIGAHSFEPAEEKFVREHDIKVFTLDEVKKIGFAKAFDHALKRATDGTEAFGLTIDMDGFHPDESPGVGTAENDGLRQTDVLPTLSGIARHPKFSGLEIVEYNPHKDMNKTTATLIYKIIAHLFSEY